MMLSNGVPTLSALLQPMLCNKFVFDAINAELIIHTYTDNDLLSTIFSRNAVAMASYVDIRIPGDDTYIIVTRIEVALRQGLQCLLLHLKSIQWRLSELTQ